VGLQPVPEEAHLLQEVQVDPILVVLQDLEEVDDNCKTKGYEKENPSSRIGNFVLAWICSKRA
jgi:hypothetical protein